MKRCRPFGRRRFFASRGGGHTDGGGPCRDNEWPFSRGSLFLAEGGASPGSLLRPVTPPLRSSNGPVTPPRASKALRHKGLLVYRNWLFPIFIKITKKEETGCNCAQNRMLRLSYPPSSYTCQLHPLQKGCALVGTEPLLQTLLVVSLLPASCRPVVIAKSWKPLRRKALLVPYYL